MKRDFIIEIGTEEIPAGFIGGAIESFHNGLTDKIRSSLIGYDKSYFYSTPRRMVVVITGMEESQKDLVEEIKGPPKKAAFSDLGRPTQAALGFIQTNNATMNDIAIKSTGKGEYLFITRTTKGAQTVAILPSIIAGAIQSLTFPKSMKWDSSEVRFARPVRWIVCLFGEEVVRFRVGGVESSNETRGLRRSGKRSAVKSANAYLDVMKELLVVADPKVRCNTIVTELNSIAEKLGLKPYKSEDLISEVANLTENPFPILCEFNRDYLKIPDRILTSTMIKKQRYFPLYDQQGKLSEKFVVFSDGKPEQVDEVKYGNQKVIAARFADAEFYYREDCKTTMDQKAEKLKNVVFQQKLGTMHEKTRRIASLARHLYENLILKVPPQPEYRAEKIEKISKCAGLCKADLTSEVVKEFTELQGYAGMVYAERDGASSEVAKGIFEHYMPCFKGDSLPETIEGQCVGIADKMDTIAGCFIIKMIPTGSGDPYALRRAALGIIEIALHASFSFDLMKFISHAIDIYPAALRGESGCDARLTATDIMNFLKQRFETKLKEMNVRYDVVNATLWNGVSNIYENYRKAMSLAKARTSKEFAAMITPFKRALNITKKAESTNVSEGLLQVAAEKALYEKYLSAAAAVEADLSSNDYFAAFNHLSVLNEPIDRFFTDVMVMDENVDLKNNRVALLCAIRNLFFRLVDISQLVIDE